MIPALPVVRLTSVQLLAFFDPRSLARIAESILEHGLF